MKKILFVLSFLLVFALPAMAANDNMAQNTGTDQQSQNQQSDVFPLPTGNQVQNQNQIKTQNKGEGSRLQINTQEEEKLGEERGEGLQNRNQNAIQNMSNVAQKVQELLQITTVGGIGEQVREIARLQNQAQAQIQEQLNRLESKGKLARLLTGTDFGAVKNLKAQLEQNQSRVRQLEQLKTQLSNQGDITMVQAAIEALVQQNTALQEQITAEESTKSLLGWLFRFFAK